MEILLPEQTTGDDIVFWTGEGTEANDRENHNTAG